jgi:hypothetical protein
LTGFNQTVTSHVRAGVFLQHGSQLHKQKANVIVVAADVSRLIIPVIFQEMKADSSRKAGLLQTLRFIANKYEGNLLNIFIETRAAPTQSKTIVRAKLFLFTASCQTQAGVS